MNEGRFSRSSYTTGLGVKIPDAVLAQNNNAIRDLAPGDWALGPPGSVFFDNKGDVFVRTHSDRVTEADRRTFDDHPAIGKGWVDLSGKALTGYIVDISYIRNVLALRGYEERGEGDLGDEANLPEYMKRGLSPVVGLASRQDGEFCYDGLKEFEGQTRQMSDELDNYVARVQMSGQPLVIPLLRK